MGRQLRRKMLDRGVYHHLYNHVTGPIGQLPFDDVDKEKMFLMLEDLSKFFLIEIISACCMGNHWHVTCYSGTPPIAEEAAQRYNDYYGERKPALDPVLNREECEVVARQMVDISEFMRRFQHGFTLYFNRVHKCRGRLWAGRFKNTVIEGKREALWGCVRYVELNPVRAGIVEDAADYRFCSWGRYRGSGRHPFHANFIRHMQATAELHGGKPLGSMSADAVFAEFAAELARIGKWEAEQDGRTGTNPDESAAAVMEKARRGDSMPVRFLRHSRYWVDGGIIGSQMFIRELACHFTRPEEHERIHNKQLSRGATPEGGWLHCFKRLRTT